jgi:hypothetical protein
MDLDAKYQEEEEHCKSQQDDDECSAMRMDDIDCEALPHYDFEQPLFHSEQFLIDTDQPNSLFIQPIWTTEQPKREETLLASPMMEATPYPFA